MIVGTGQLAQIFIDLQIDNTVIFASGVSNSNCTEEKEFKRERILLLKTLKENQNSKFVYFSSCALSAPDYPKNEYYKHKENMEILIKEYSHNYYIFRVPQLFGELKSHNTLINFIYESIITNRKFKIYDKAYRYVIEINDVRNLVEAYLENFSSSIIVDLANSYRYSVSDIVYTLEELLNKKANYDLINKSDGYYLDLSDVNKFILNNNINILFSKNYLYDKLKDKINLV